MIKFPVAIVDLVQHLPAPLFPRAGDAIAYGEHDRIIA